MHGTAQSHPLTQRTVSQFHLLYIQIRIFLYTHTHIISPLMLCTNLPQWQQNKTKTKTVPYSCPNHLGWGAFYDWDVEQWHPDSCQAGVGLWVCCRCSLYSHTMGSRNDHTPTPHSILSLVPPGWSAAK